MQKIRTIGKLETVEVIKRKKFNNKFGLIIKFKTPKHGVILRTFNLPSRITKYTGLGKCLLSMKLDVPNYLMKNRLLLASQIEKESAGQLYQLELETSGNEKYPFNIISIKCKQ
jgi:hypothetical protein